MAQSIRAFALNCEQMSRFGAHKLAKGPQAKKKNLKVPIFDEFLE